MSKRQKERKAALLAKKRLEREAIAARRKDRLAVTVKLVRKLVITLFFTVIILYLGIFVNKHLGEILKIIIG